MSFADATVEVVADLSEVDHDFTVGLAKAARAAGRATRPIWAAEGRAAGDAYFDEVAGRWRNSLGQFVRAGFQSGRAFDRGFKAGSRNTFKDLVSGAKAVGSVIGKTMLAGGAAIGVTALAQAAGGLGVAALAVVGSLAPLVSLVALLPGAVLGAAAAIGTLKIGFQGLGDAVSAGLSGDTEAFDEALKALAPNAQAVARAVVGLKDQLRDLRFSVQQPLFDQVGGQLQKLAKVWLPEASRSMAAFAKIFNTAFRDVAAVALTVKFLADIQAGLRGAQGGAAGLLAQIGPLTAAMGTLAAVGAPFLARIGVALGGAAGGLAAFVERIAASGELAGMLERAFTAATNLGVIFANIGVTIRNVVKAASDAVGGDLLASFAAVTGQLAKLSGSGALTSLFAGLMANLGVVTTVIGAFFKALQPLQGVITSTLGRLEGPLVALFDALGKGLEALAPAFGPFTDFLVQVGGLLVTLLPPVGALIGGLVSMAAIALVPLVKILDIVLQAITPFVDIFAKSWQQISATVLPVIMQIVEALGVRLAPVFARLIEKLAPFLPQIAEMAALFAGQLAASMPELIDAFGRLSAALLPLVDEIAGSLIGALQEVAPHLPELAKAFTDFALSATELLVALAPLITQLLAGGDGINFWLLAVQNVTGVLQFAAGQVRMWIDAVKAIKGGLDNAAAGFAFFGALAGRVWAAVTGAFDAGRLAVGEAISAIGGFFAQVGAALARAWDGAVAGFAAFVAFVASVPGLIGAFLARLPELVGTAIGTVVAFFFALPGKIRAAISNLTTTVVAFFTDLFAWWTQFVSDSIDAVIDFFVKLPGRIVAAISNLTTMVVTFFTDLFAWWTQFVSDSIDAVIDFFVKLPGRVIAAVDGLIDDITVWARSLFDGATSEVSDGIDDIVDFFIALPGRIGAAIVNFASSAWNGLKGFINDGVKIINRIIAAYNKVPGTPQISPVPELANGIYAVRPMMAVIAEAGPEVVIPMSASRRGRAVALAAQSGLTAALAQAGALSQIPGQRQPVSTVTNNNNVTVNTAALDPETVALKVSARIARLAAVT